MKRVEFQVALYVTVVVLTAGALGCTDQQAVSDARRAATRTTAKPGPEESFELILETFRRGIEGVPIGFVISSEGGHSMMVGKSEVSHQLIRPAKVGDPYKAIITVDSEARYSIQRSTTRDDDAQREEQSRNQASQSSIGGKDDPLSINILDPDLVGTPSSGNPNRRPTPPGEETSVARMPPNEVKKSYELLYQNGRWSLVSELDPETEQSIENAFQQALKTQI